MYPIQVQFAPQNHSPFTYMEDQKNKQYLPLILIAYVFAFYITTTTSGVPTDAVAITKFVGLGFVLLIVPLALIRFAGNKLVEGVPVTYEIVMILGVNSIITMKAGGTSATYPQKVISPFLSSVRLATQSGKQ